MATKAPMNQDVCDSEVRKAGRPRSEESTSAILDATWNLLLTRPLQDISIEAIARESGVGKATIYRWWPSKCSVVIDSMIEKVATQIEFPECESAAQSLELQMQSLIRAFAGDYGRILGQIVAESQACPERLENFRKNFIYNRREMVRAIMEKGIASGEFRKDLNIEIATDLLYGPIYYRLLVKHMPLDKEFEENFPIMAIKCLIKSE